MSISKKGWSKVTTQLVFVPYKYKTNPHAVHTVCDSLNTRKLIAKQSPPAIPPSFISASLK